MRSKADDEGEDQQQKVRHQQRNGAARQQEYERRGRHNGDLALSEPYPLVAEGKMVNTDIQYASICMAMGPRCLQAYSLYPKIEVILASLEVSFY